MLLLHFYNWLEILLKWNQVLKQKQIGNSVAEKIIKVGLNWQNIMQNVRRWYVETMRKVMYD